MQVDRHRGFTDKLCLQIQNKMFTNTLCLQKKTQTSLQTSYVYKTKQNNKFTDKLCLQNKTESLQTC